MADDVTVKGGLYDITFRNALAAPDDAVTGDKPNIMNMALARGCWFQYEYTVQIDLKTDKVVADVEALGVLQTVYADMANWTAADFDGTATMMGKLNQLFDLGTGSALTDKVKSVAITGSGGQTSNWPPITTVPGTGTAIGQWADVQNQPGPYFGGRIFQTSDGVYFQKDLSTGALVEVPKDNIVLLVDPGDNLGITASDIASARQQVQTTIESKTQRNQEDQAQLQDLTAALQRWFAFTTNVNERKKRDADSIVGNFH